MSSFINEEERIIKEIEEIIKNNPEAIINPFDNNVHPLIRDIVCPNENEPCDYGKIAKIIDNQVKKYDCYKDINKKSKECENIVGKNTKIGRHINNLKNNRITIDDRQLLGAINDYNNKHDTVAYSPTTVTQVPTGGRKKTRKRRRKKKSKRKKTRRRRKKKKTRRRRKKKKRKKSKRKKRSRKLRGGNYWKFNEDTKQYEVYTSNNFFGRSKIVKFNSLTDFTKHWCKNFNKNKKKYHGLIQHPRIFNKDPELKIFKDRRKGADNSGINIYQYKCGNCSKIITYNDEERKAIQFSGWDYGKLPSKKEENLDKFNKYIKEQQQQQQQSINNRRGRSDSAHDFKYREVSPSVYNDVLYEYNPNDDDW